MWSYQYGGSDSYRPQLKGVTLPAGEHWSFNLSGLVAAYMDFEDVNPGNCYVAASPGNLSTAVFSGSITHPSGLTGTFQVRPLAHGRSGVYRNCWGVRTAPNVDGYAITPSLWYSLTLTNKSFAGAGMNTQSWAYQYSAPHDSWQADCPNAWNCASTITTDVIDPAGRATRYTFSNRYDYTESLLLRTDTYQGGVGSAVARSEINQYAAPTSGPWPQNLGYNLQSTKQNDGQTTQWFPLNQRTLQQDGDTYTWQAQAFNEFAQVTQAKRFNNIGGQPTATEQTAYLNDRPHWVLGQVISSATNGIESSRTDYDATSVLPTAHSNFGKIDQRLTYYADGTVGSVKDGNNNVIALANYKRGIPQRITLPATPDQPSGTVMTALVDDFGQVTAVADATGAKTC